MNITTLPLSYRPKRPFRVLFTPFIASCFAKFCGFKQIFPINLMGLRKEAGVELNASEIMSAYQNDLFSLGVDTESASFFSDTEDRFLKFVSESTLKRVNSGECQKFEQSISFCPCGKVEIPSKLLSEINAGNRLKLVKKVGSVWKCALCGGDLNESREITLIHRMLRSGEDVKILPENRRLKVEIELKSFIKNPILVSRAHRSQEKCVMVQGKFVDPDYCWLHFLDFLNCTYGMNDFVVVAGVNQISQACKLISFTNTINPDIKLTLLVSSIIDLDNMNCVVNKKTTLDELVGLLGSTKAVRLFVASMAQWKREVCKVNCDDIYLIRKTLNNEEVFSEPLISSPPCTIEDLVGKLNRESVVRILKEIRQKKIISSDDWRFFSSIT